MNKKINVADDYRRLIFDKILTLAPVIAITAALTFTCAKFFGFYQGVEWGPLIWFDVVCFLYCIPAYILKKIGCFENGKLSERKINRLCLLLDLLVLLQWNLITYIFPTKSFWGFAPMFLLLTSFMFKTKPVLWEAIGLSVSIAVSWIVMPDEFLPASGDGFGENLVLRIVALLLTFAVILILTHNAQRFTEEIKKNHQEMEEKNNELKKMGLDVLDFSAEIIEERDYTSGTHVKRIKKYTYILAKQVMDNYKEYSLTEELINNISLASALHDIGKIGIPDGILLKPGKLTKEEFEVIKTHTLIGGNIVDKLPDSVGIEFKYLCKEICMFHHERYDGKGYPSGLIGDQIPIAAQIVAVVDCFDALSNERPYKSALPKELAIKMILDGECGAFSDKIKQCILDCKDELINN